MVIDGIEKKGKRYLTCQTCYKHICERCDQRCFGRLYAWLPALFLHARHAARRCVVEGPDDLCCESLTPNRFGSPTWLHKE